MGSMWDIYMKSSLLCIWCDVCIYISMLFLRGLYMKLSLVGLCVYVWCDWMCGGVCEIQSTVSIV